MINQTGVRFSFVPVYTPQRELFLKAALRGAPVAPSLFLYQHFIKQVNGRLYTANKRSVPTEALNPLRFDDDDRAFVIGSELALSISHACAPDAETTARGERAPAGV
ncbi:hypothetical protein O0L34_g11448 [Tuta absoluta]|nr:hypothetical protein O0L34_g11448 [Tuta absoluta]